MTESKMKREVNKKGEEQQVKRTEKRNWEWNKSETMQQDNWISEDKKLKTNTVWIMQ